ncbi:MAG: hypothetical protein K8T91_17305 [Planctomycetes bacterium]|nr:hypothetical protein [Planctomycetota bacterium]
MANDVAERYRLSEGLGQLRRVAEMLIPARPTSQLESTGIARGQSEGQCRGASAGAGDGDQTPLGLSSSKRLQNLR